MAADAATKRKKGMEVEGYPVEGLSIGGQETCVIFPGLKMAFDIGRCPQRAISQDYLFISHGHMDHIGGLPMYVATRGLYKMKPPTIFVPASIKENVEKLFEAHRAMDQSELKHNLVALNVGEEYQLRKDLKVRTFRTYHAIPSQGYLIYSVRHKLKQDYAGLKGDEIKNLKLSGVEITYTITLPEVAFTGDTMSDFIDDPDNIDVLKARVLVMEELACHGIWYLCQFVQDKGGKTPEFLLVVLDVGTGSGILAIWCAQAGAKKVYAVEATQMSEHARELVKANQVEDIVQVIHASMEDVTLPEKVDVIISEWMGYFLLRESMFDSVICARDRWLKPNGMMYPSHARMWVAPIRSGLGEQKKSEFDSAMSDWYSFVDETEAHYGVNMSVLTKPFHAEHEKYYLQTSLWNNVHPNQVIGSSVIVKEIDCLKATVDEISNVTAKFSSLIDADKTQISGFAGWFDVHFRGNDHNPARHEVELTTAPSIEDCTHWGQQVFLLHPPLRVNVGDNVEVSFTMSRSKQYHRLMDVKFTTILHKSSGKSFRPVTSQFFIE